MKTLPISVIIPTYNRGSVIARAVASALLNCRERDEIIVVDDESKDDTGRRLSAYEGRIQYFQIPHGGAGKARNWGVRQARHPLVAFLDSDDEWFPGKLDLQRALFQKCPEVLFCFSDFAVRQASGREQRHYLIRWHRDFRSWEKILGPGFLFSTLGELPHGRKDFFVHVGNLYQLELKENYIFTSTLVVRREVAGDALHFAEDLPTYEDWECFGRLARAGPGAYLDCETAWQVSFKGPRLTDVHPQISAAARLAVVKRIWGKDESFLNQNRRLYDQVINQLQIKQVKGLVREGNTLKARRVFQGIKEPPLSVRLMTNSPGFLASSLLRLRDFLRL